MHPFLGSRMSNPKGKKHFGKDVGINLEVQKLTAGNTLIQGFSIVMSDVQDLKQEYKAQNLSIFRAGASNNVHPAQQRNSHFTLQ